MTKRKFLVTGGAGFIGSHFVELLVQKGHEVVVLDALTYAGHEENLEGIKGSGVFRLEVGDICDREKVRKILSSENVSAVINFAAESHVDRSISDPGEFVRTNVWGTFNLLECAREYWENLKNEDAKNRFRYVQISTDEVFGTLGEEGRFTEKSQIQPNSPYSASKAGGDHLVRAAYHTYQFPTITTHCSNNYGPRQFPEKLIPFMVSCALLDRPLGVYGDGKNIRDWIHVKDHCEGIWLAMEKGRLGESYCFGGDAEKRNIDLVRILCAQLDDLFPRKKGKYEELITFVKDRKGHDFRYAIDSTKAKKELGFQCKYDFENGIRDTVSWYLENQDWIQKVKANQKKKLESGELAGGVA